MTKAYSSEPSCCRTTDTGVAFRSRSLWGRLLSLTTCAAISLASHVAYACGAAQLMVEMLAPLPQATAIPRNAALMARSNLSRLAFRLHEVGSSEEIALAVSCDGHFDGNLCLAYAGTLKPNTTYEWSAGGEPSSKVPQTFTTGTDEDPYPPIANGETLTVLEHTRHDPIPCAGSSSSRLRFSFQSLNEPAVLALTGSNGTYRAILLRPEHPTTEETLANAPSCIIGRLIDFAGNSRSVQFPCDARLASSETSVPSPDEGGGCAFGGAARAQSALSFLIILGVVRRLLRRRAKGDKQTAQLRRH
jgi:hypothetical protein